MPYQPYYPGGWQPGPDGGTPITHEALNRMETQYQEAAADLNAHKSANPIDHPDGSVTAAKLASGAVTAGKLADGAVDTLTRIASEVRTSPGGTEPNRLAVTNASGRVGDSIRIGGMRIITGRQTATGGNGTISFGFTFSSSPVIVATIERTSGTGNRPRIIEINSRSTTGFSWTVRDPDSTTGSGTTSGWTAFYWIAIGPG